MTLSILDSLGAQLDVLIYVVTFVYQVTFDVATGLLGAFGYGIDDILALWPAP